MFKEEKELVQCEFMPGFYKVPGYPFSASREGYVYSYHLKMIPVAFFDPLKVSENKYIHVDKFLAHRLIAMTFLKPPIGMDVSEALINHKNGLKYDNTPHNLEWTTHAGNLSHAYEIGLREGNSPIKTYDVLSGHTQYFYSFWSCARRYGINGARVHGYLNRIKYPVLFLERYLLVYQSEDFPKEDDWKTWKLSAQDVEFVAFNTETRQSFVFSNERLAYEFVGISVKTRQKLVRKAMAEYKHEYYFNEWILCPHSRFRHTVLEIFDKRIPREVRYANYKPKAKNGFVNRKKAS